MASLDAESYFTNGLLQPEEDTLDGALYFTLGLIQDAVTGELRRHELHYQVTPGKPLIDTGPLVGTKMRRRQSQIVDDLAEIFIKFLEQK